MHDYTARIVWTGNRGGGTVHVDAYDRDYTIRIEGKADLDGSADPIFRGRPERHNPEDLFLAALSACHMLTFLALAARRGIEVVAYEDRAHGRLALSPGGGGAFERVQLNPRVEVVTALARDVVPALHEAAHANCFIANSVAVPVEIAAEVHVRETPLKEDAS